MARRATRSSSDWKRVGYDNFSAAEGGAGDGKESCVAALHFELPNGTRGRVAGATGKDRGHAEMDALHVFFTERCDSDVDTFSNATKIIECTSKPCCVNCSAVLGLCGIAHSDGTYKTASRMGSTQWGISLKVRDLLAALCDDKAEKFAEFDD